MNTAHTNALQRMRLARRATPRVVDGSRAPALPKLGAGAGVRAACFASGVIARYTNLPRHLSHGQMVYPAPPFAPPGSLRRVLHEHRHQVSIALRLSPALLKWSGTPSPVARNGARHPATDPPATGRSASLARPEVAPLRTLLRLAGADTGFDAKGLPTQRMRSAMGHGSGRELGEELTPVEIARVLREQGSLVLAAANPHLLQPIASRAERIEMVASTTGAVREASGPSRGRAPEAVAAQAVPRVVHRPATAPVEPDDESAARGLMRGNHAHPAPWADLSSGGRQATLDPAHLHRLAEQVVRVIDDRVVATRERMGRT